MRHARLPLSILVLLSAASCEFSNAPFFPVYKVEMDITDVDAVVTNKSIKGTFQRGTIEAITEGIGSCSVQLKLGQCKEGEEVWVNFRAMQDDPTASRARCTPSVWQRLKDAEGKSLALAPVAELTRNGNSVYVEVLAGPNTDEDGNGVIDKHSVENRVATRPMTIGRIDIYKATDYAGSSSWPPYGEFLADLDVGGPGIGFVRGRIDAAVDALDGTPVGPRCNWEVEALQEDN